MNLIIETQWGGYLTVMLLEHIHLIFPMGREKTKTMQQTIKRLIENSLYISVSNRPNTFDSLEFRGKHVL